MSYCTRDGFESLGNTRVSRSASNGGFVRFGFAGDGRVHSVVPGAIWDGLRICPEITHKLDDPG